MMNMGHENALGQPIPLAEAVHTLSEFANFSNLSGDRFLFIKKTSFARS
jgi:hypothetical protein